MFFLFVGLADCNVSIRDDIRAGGRGRRRETILELENCSLCNAHLLRPHLSKPNQRANMYFAYKSSVLYVTRLMMTYAACYEQEHSSVKVIMPYD